MTMVRSANDEAAARLEWRARAAGVELFALCGFGVAQPTFDVLSRNSTFLIAHALGPRQLLLFAIALVAVPPLTLLGVESVVALVSHRAVRALHSSTVGVLFALAIVPPVVHGVRLPEIVQTLLFAAAIALGAYVYFAHRTPRRYLRWLWPAPIVFAVAFLTVGPVSAFFGGGRARAEDADGSRSQATVASRPLPSVIYLVLDEFALGSMLRPDGSIDARRFPNLDRLASRATWYPNATTNANMTPAAVPAALTGRFPDGPGPPTMSSNPRNLFSLLEATHELIAGETVTSLCPASRCRQIASPATAVKHVFADTALVYLHSVSPPLLKRPLPELPENEWGGFFADPASVRKRVANVPRLVRPVARTVLTALADNGVKSSRELRRMDSFFNSIRKPTRPTVWFHHALLPHWPWHLTEDARPYDDVETPGFVNGGFLNRQAAEDAMQRYLLQVKGVDSLIGHVIDRLESEGMWDDALIVIHADHGLTFRAPGQSRSIEGAPNDVLPVPFFVKYPGQRSGRVDRRNVELVDILPTIADAVGVALHWKTDGTSLLVDGPGRPQKRAWQGRSETPLPPFDVSIDPTGMSRQIRRLFGAPTPSDDLYGWGPYQRLVGRPAADLRPAAAISVDLEIDGPERFDRVDLDESLLPARVSARFRPVDSPWVAVGLNGVIAGVGRPFGDGAGSSQRVFVMLSPRLLREGHNELMFYAIESKQQIVPLTP
jgi:hypothetical protein